MTEENMDRPAQEASGKHGQGSSRGSLVTLASSWWSNKAAERCALLPWALVLGVFLASSLAIALPFGAGRWRDARASAELSRYPGLGAAFMAVAERGGGFAVRDGSFKADSDAPREFEINGWRVSLGAEGGPEPDGPKALWFGADRFVVSNPDTGYALASDWLPFEGLDAGLFRRASQDRLAMAELIAGMLYTAAFTGMGSTILTVGLLMLVQNLFFITILGLFLSLSALRKGLRPEGAGTRIEPLKGIKVAASAIAGPAFLVGLIGLLLPALNAALLWLAYSLLGGIRIVLIYMARYRSKA
jgi:hypothetical protein